MYCQCRKIAVGSPLGELFANIYIGLVEERVFSELPVPPIYCRYIDDTIVEVDAEDPQTLRDVFIANSSLHFTCEQSNKGKLSSLTLN